MLDGLFDIEGKSAVVTGGSRGIGLMIARGLLASGVRVYICARKADECDAAATELSRFGTCVSIPTDLQTDDGCRHLVAEVAQREHALHILVNNAGAAWGVPVEEYPLEAFDKVFGLNVRAVFHLTRLFLPLLRAAATASDPARVINIGSVDGLRPPALENYAYSASKAAVHMLTRHVGRALAADHITVNAVAPGLFPTRMTKFLFDGSDAEESAAAEIPLGRPGCLEDIAGAVIYLSSRAGAYVAGAVIPVAGGAATLVE
jgi:NAD(P)-dependent dehydrogenase (short-subunit alcohol dehydrogenase family)